MGVDSTLLLTWAYEVVYYGDGIHAHLICTFCKQFEHVCDCYRENCTCKWHLKYKINNNRSYIDIVRKYDPEGIYHKIIYGPREDMPICDNMTARIPTPLRNEVVKAHCSLIRFSKISNRLKKIFHDQTWLGGKKPMIHGHPCECGQIIYVYPSIYCVLRYKIDQIKVIKRELEILPQEIMVMVLTYIEKDVDLKELMRIYNIKSYDRLDYVNYDFYLNFNC